MRNHIIPQKYLLGFTNPQNLIWTYRVGADDYFCTSPKNTAVVTNYYADEDEVLLSQQIENPAVEAIDKLRQRISIKPEEKKRLASYLANMMMRVPAGKRQVKDMQPRVLNEVFSKENITSTMGHLSPNQWKKMAQLRRDWETGEDKTNELWRPFLRPESLPNTQAALERMTWQFLIFDTEPAFVTSDNPVFYFRDIGIGNSLSEVSFPISQNIVLWATWNENSSYEFVPVTKNVVIELNRRTRVGAANIYSPVKAQWVANLAQQSGYMPCRIISPTGKYHRVLPSHKKE